MKHVVLKFDSHPDLYYVSHIQTDGGSDTMLHTATFSTTESMAMKFEDEVASTIAGDLIKLAQDPANKECAIAQVTYTGTARIVTQRRMYLTPAEQIKILSEHEIKVEWFPDSGFDDDDDADVENFVRLVDSNNKCVVANYDQATTRARAEALGKALLEYVNNMVNDDAQTEIRAVQEVSE